MAAVTNMKRLRQANASLSGLLLNHGTHRGGSYGYDYSNYYYNDDKQTEAEPRKELLPPCAASNYCNHSLIRVE